MRVVDIIDSNNRSEKQVPTGQQCDDIQDVNNAMMYKMQTMRCKRQKRKKENKGKERC